MKVANAINGEGAYNQWGGGGGAYTTKESRVYVYYHNQAKSKESK